MEATREDLIKELEASNSFLRRHMASDAKWDLRYQSYEQLQRNLRSMGVAPEVIAAIPEPASNYVPKDPNARPWRPDPADYNRTFEDVGFPV